MDVRRLLSVIDTAERILIALLAGTALGLASFAMATRYFAPKLSTDWTFELVIFTVIWATFLASARMVGHGGHVRVDILLGLFRPLPRLLLAFFGVLFSLALALFLLVSGFIVTVDAFHWDERTMSTLRLPLWLYYLCLPVGAFLSAVHLCSLGARLVTGSIRDESPGAGTH